MTHQNIQGGIIWDGWAGFVQGQILTLVSRVKHPPTSPPPNIILHFTIATQPPPPPAPPKKNKKIKHDFEGAP